MEQQISIPKTAALTYGLPAIVRAFENAQKPTIFACDNMQNAKLECYWPAATVGECTPIAYDRPETAMAFFEVLARAATTGRDLDYMPQLLTNEPCKVLMFTHTHTCPLWKGHTITHPLAALGLPLVSGF